MNPIIFLFVAKGQVRLTSARTCPGSTWQGMVLFCRGGPVFDPGCASEEPKWKDPAFLALRGGCASATTSPLRAASPSQVFADIDIGGALQFHFGDVRHVLVPFVYIVSGRPACFASTASDLDDPVRPWVFYQTSGAFCSRCFWRHRRLELIAAAAAALCAVEFCRRRSKIDRMSRLCHTKV